MPPVNVLIKPASSACNMACTYCFYRDVACHRQENFQGMLSLDLMEKVIAGAMEFAEGSCSFLFQGGEPTLAGLDYLPQRRGSGPETLQNERGCQLCDSDQCVSS